MTDKTLAKMLKTRPRDRNANKLQIRTSDKRQEKEILAKIETMIEQDYHDL